MVEKSVNEVGGIWEEWKWKRRERDIRNDEGDGVVRKMGIWCGIEREKVAMCMWLMTEGLEGKQRKSSRAPAMI